VLVELVSALAPLEQYIFDKSDRLIGQLNRDSVDIGLGGCDRLGASSE